MPLTAVFDDRHVLDATAPDLGGAVDWSAIYRARPRAPLRCRGCGGQMQARESVLGQRFFRHDAAVPDCPMAGETPAHRELKNELAAAIRAAGWTAELEVPGTGWRADVLAVSPDGDRRIAWEAQLASTTADKLRERTDTMRRELDGVCWVTKKDVPWVGALPGIRLMRSPERTVVSTGSRSSSPPGAATVPTARSGSSTGGTTDPSSRVRATGRGGSRTASSSSTGVAGLDQDGQPCEGCKGQWTLTFHPDGEPLVEWYPPTDTLH